MDGPANRCRCGREIPFDPARKKQHRYCAACRARIGGSKQRGHKKTPRRLATPRSTKENAALA